MPRLWPLKREDGLTPLPKTSMGFRLSYHCRQNEGAGDGIQLQTISPGLWNPSLDLATPVTEAGFFSFMQTWTRLGALLHGAVDSSYHFSMESLHYYTILIISFMLLSHPSLVSRLCLHGNSSCFALFIWAGESSAAPGHLGDIIWKRLLYTMETLQQSPFQESSVTEHRKCISLMCHCPEILNRWHDWSSFI